MNKLKKSNPVFTKEILEEAEIYMSKNSKEIQKQKKDFLNQVFSGIGNIEKLI